MFSSVFRSVRSVVFYFVEELIDNGRTHTKPRRRREPKFSNTHYQQTHEENTPTIRLD